MRDMLRHFRGRAGRSSQRCHERAGCDAIHIDAVRAELTRQRLCELDYPRLGRRVGRAARRGPRRIVRRRAGAERRRDVDDLAVGLPDHLWCGCLSAIEHALQIHIQHEVPVFIGDCQERPIARDAGIVHQDVHSAVRRDNLGHERVDLPAIGNIDSQSGGATACSLDFVDDGRYRSLVLVG